jgi:hypothetical protein
MQFDARLPGGRAARNNLGANSGSFAWHARDKSVALRFAKRIVARPRMLRAGGPRDNQTNQGGSPTRKHALTTKDRRKPLVGIRGLCVMAPCGYNVTNFCLCSLHGLGRCEED